MAACHERTVGSFPFRVLPKTEKRGDASIAWGHEVTAVGSVLRFSSCPKSESHFETEKGDPEHDGTLRHSIWRRKLPQFPVPDSGPRDPRNSRFRAVPKARHKPQTRHTTQHDSASPRTLPHREVNHATPCRLMHRDRCILPSAALVEAALRTSSSAPVTPPFQSSRT